jgi:hypothetical protein
MTAKTKQKYDINQSPLYNLQSKKKLADIFKTSLTSLENISQEAEPYTRFWKHKKNKKNVFKEPSEDIISDYRVIDNPSLLRKQYQARLKTLLSRIKVPEYLFSPVKGKSYRDNAHCHVNSKYFYGLDIANFFPSCSIKNVIDFFLHELKCSRDVTAILVEISTYNEALPQGSPASPFLAYFINAKMFNKIYEIVSNDNCLLSVYVDDITISSNNPIPQEMIWSIKKTIFNQNLLTKKEKEWGSINKCSITGCIIKNKKIALPNKQHKKMYDLKTELIKNKKGSIENKKMEASIKGLESQHQQILKCN